MRSPRDGNALRPGGLTCSGPRRPAASRLSPTTSLSPKWRVYMAAFPGRQAVCSAFLVDFVGYSGGGSIDSKLSVRAKAAQDSIRLDVGVRRSSNTKFTLHGTCVIKFPM